MTYSLLFLLALAPSPHAVAIATLPGAVCERVAEEIMDVAGGWADCGVVYQTERERRGE